MTFKTTIQRELDGFYWSVLDQDFNMRAVRKGAFSRARVKLNPPPLSIWQKQGQRCFINKYPCIIRPDIDYWPWTVPGCCYRGINR